MTNSSTFFMEASGCNGRSDKCRPLRFTSSLLLSFGKVIMTGRKTIALISVTLFAGLIVVFFKPLSIAYCELTGSPQSWIKRSSPLRSPIQGVWKNWGSDGLAESDAVKEIAKIINRELPPGSDDESVRAHIRSHFDRPDFHPMGARMETAYHQDAHGATYPHESASLEVWYVSYKNEFIRAEIHMGRFKGGDMHYVALNSESGRPIHIEFSNPSAEQD